MAFGTAYGLETSAVEGYCRRPGIGKAGKTEWRVEGPRSVEWVFHWGMSNLAQENTLFVCTKK